MLYICNVHPFWQLLPILPNRVWTPITTWTPLSGFWNFRKHIDCILLVELLLLLMTRNKNNCCKKNPKTQVGNQCCGLVTFTMYKGPRRLKCSYLPYTLKLFSQLQRFLPQFFSYEQGVNWYEQWVFHRLCYKNLCSFACNYSLLLLKVCRWCFTSR